jgi:hypothetical protein
MQESLLVSVFKSGSLRSRKLSGDNVVKGMRK